MPRRLRLFEGDFAQDRHDIEEAAPAVDSTLAPMPTSETAPGVQTGATHFPAAQTAPPAQATPYRTEPTTAPHPTTPIGPATSAAPTRDLPVIAPEPGMPSPTLHPSRE